MPIYQDSFSVSNGRTDIRVHRLDYCSKYLPNKDTPSRIDEKQGVDKKLICMSSCMTSGTKSVELLNEEEREQTFRKGQVFEGYFVRTKNGSYDYCYKIWTNRRLNFPPLNSPTPPKDKVNDAIIIDQNEDFLGLACGSHLAFCRKKALEEFGIDVEAPKFPCGAVRVKLRKVFDGRPVEIPYAAFEAIPVSKEEEEKLPSKKVDDPATENLEDAMEKLQIN